MEVISGSLERKVALSECKERKWSTSSFGTTIMPCNLAEGEKWKGGGKRSGARMDRRHGRGKNKGADIQGPKVREVVVRLAYLALCVSLAAA